MKTMFNIQTDEKVASIAAVLPDFLQKQRNFKLHSGGKHIKLYFHGIESTNETK
jgi:coproporphyrinogen III oxidase